MYSLRLEERVLNILSNVKAVPAKVHRQITVKIFWLQVNPRPPDCKRIGIGYCMDVGEYRILYTVDDEIGLVSVELVGPRNDAEIYKQARNLGLL
jgi:mRNA-degrading endonuclease RelE of RelBE toxin-antitoxin system